MPGLAVVLPTSVELGKGTAMETMSAKLDSSVVKTIARPSTLVLIVQRIVASQQVQHRVRLQVQLQLVQLVMAATLPGTAAAPPINAAKRKETVTMTANVSRGWCVAKTTVNPSSRAPTLKQTAVSNQLWQPGAMGVPVLGVVALLIANVDMERVTAILTMNASLVSSAGKTTAKTSIVEPIMLLIAAFQALGY